MIISYIVLFLFSTALDPIPHLTYPPFLQNVTKQGRIQYFEILNNRSLTIAQQDSEIGQWASQYGVENLYNEYEANVTAHEQVIRENVTSVIDGLPATQTALEGIYANTNQTREEQREAIRQLKQEYPNEVSTLFYISSHFRKRSRK